MRVLLGIKSRFAGQKRPGLTLCQTRPFSKLIWINMDFTIVIPVLNEEKRIGPCIKALLDQDYPKDKYEILIVDNGSHDTSVKIIQSYERVGDPRLKLLFEPKGGITFARQRALEEAKGTYYITTDADAIPPKGWLKSAKKVFDKDPGIVGITGPTYGHDADIFTNQFLAYGGLLAANTPKHKVIMGCNMAFVTDKARQVGGFILGEHKYHEDSIISVRLRKIGRLKVDKEFYNYISARRYKGIKIFNFVNNLINYLGVRLFNRPVFDYFPEIR